MIATETLSAMPTPVYDYFCPFCKAIVKRKENKKRIKSYCRKAEKTVYIVRHGQTQTNDPGNQRATPEDCPTGIYPAHDFLAVMLAFLDRNYYLYR